MKSATIRLGLLLSIACGLALLVGCGGPKTPPPPEKLKVDRFTTQQGLPHDHITALVSFGTQVWAGTRNGLARFDGVNWQVHVTKNTNALGSNIIENLTVADGAVWISTDNGVTRTDGTNWASIFTGSRARAATARGSEIAVATAHGVDYTTGGSFISLSKETAGLVYDEVQALCYDANGKLWVGTRAGMAQLNGQVFQNFTGPAQQPMGTSLIEIPPNPPNCQLVGNNINAIVPYKGKLAIATTSGLTITDMANQWTSYTSTHKKWVQRAGKIFEEQAPGNSPLPGPSITALAVAPNDAALFVGTNKGLAILQDGKWLEFENRLATVPSGAITALVMHEKDLWVGTQSGLFRIINLASLLSAS
ncbi:MAG: two-component system sensor histidine kinase/response regulator, hybrid ('one-component system') [Candidatus Ozemobacter sibiricus]|jgi:ligand-binding sensor domain-containing protein|uniref:Two-component system sensor histidine kinase/response regulator, hybrid ('one-component system') n=1 Tax=Candidatus Ozemobacter sibiricus TaxID=2268124 RepID=A0A367ZSW8_9BACT|nr:MAG: two-component system sensor histidine kinase/response regulator, hybrid ('one-component system') [Candidatus Ozemobacter sibiricus]